MGSSPPPLPPTEDGLRAEDETEGALRDLLVRRGCAERAAAVRAGWVPPSVALGAVSVAALDGADEGDLGLAPARDPAAADESARTACEHAELVLRHLRRRHEAYREASAEQEAGEAMGRMTRAFVLLCVLRIVVAHQQRRRYQVERGALP